MSDNSILSIEHVANRLNNGEIGVIATDTVYGVVCRLDNQDAVERIYSAKRRDHDKPVGTILIAHVGQLTDIASVDMHEIAQHYWPGPVSIIVPVTDQLTYAHKGLGSLPFRVPNDERLRTLLRLTGPLATSSANVQGSSPATTIAESRNYFGSAVDFYWDGGELVNRSASKIIAINSDGTIATVRA